MAQPPRWRDDSAAKPRVFYPQPYNGHTVGPWGSSALEMVALRAIPAQRVLLVWGLPSARQQQWLELRDDEFDAYWGRQPTPRRRDIDRPTGTVLFEHSQGFSELAQLLENN